MFWDVGKSRDEVSEIENFVRKKGAEQTSSTMGVKKKERKENKRMQQSSNSFHKKSTLVWEFTTSELTFYLLLQL